MWYEGKANHWQEVSQQTKDFFEENEDKRLILEDYWDKDLLESENAMDILDDSYLPWIPVNIDVPWEDIYKEANHLLWSSCFTLHRPNSSGWLSLAIHGISSVHTNCPEDYNLPEIAEYELSGWTDLAKFCPKTVEWMEQTVKYEKFTRVRFMAVLPGGWLGPHKDRERIKGVGATNIAINNPEGCALVMEDFGKLPFTPGKAFKINTGYRHAVWNRSEEPRIHMIFDGDQGEYFVQRVKDGYASM